MAHRLLLVGLGGMVGSMLRYWLGGLVQSWANGPFPLGTLAVNVLGSGILGLVMALALERGWFGLEARLFLTVGVCGGFTTMSTFSYETLALAASGELQLAVWNVLASVLCCLFSVWLGMTVGRMI